MKISMLVAPDRVDLVSDAATRAWLPSLGDVTWFGGDIATADLAPYLHNADVVVTSWGTPPLPGEHLTGPGAPTVIAHAAGTVRRLLANAPDELTAFSGAPRIAQSVGEYCLTAALALRRDLPRADRDMRDGNWRPGTLNGQELFGATVGIIGASATARAFIALLVPFGVDLRIYDPYLSDAAASALGGQRVDLAEAMSCEVISLHVPDLPETEGLITAQLLDLIPSGGVFINSARAASVDTAALVGFAREGRLRAALDVFDVEPPSLTADVRECPNLLLTPHLAGNTRQGRRDLTRYVLTQALDWLETGTHGTGWVDPTRRGVSA